MVSKLLSTNECNLIIEHNIEFNFIITRSGVLGSDQSGMVAMQQGTEAIPRQPRAREVTLRSEPEIFTYR